MVWGCGMGDWLGALFYLAGGGAYDGLSDAGKLNEGAEADLAGFFMRIGLTAWRRAWGNLVRPLNRLHGCTACSNVVRVLLCVYMV
jgi:hypothetical protein